MTDAKQYLIAFAYVAIGALAFLAIAATFFPERWHEVTW